MHTQVIVFIFLLLANTTMAQENEYLVYAVKGNVALVDNGKEVPLKIGRILKASSQVNIKTGGVVTFLCNSIRPFTLREQPLTILGRFGDSCKYAKEAVLTNYFKYVWDKMYASSADNGMRAQMMGKGSVVRADPNSEQAASVEITEGLDTIRYAKGLFPLTWNTENVKGPVTFLLYSAVDDKLVWRKKVTGDQVELNNFASRMKPGQLYYWTIRYAPTSESDKKYIIAQTSTEVHDFVKNLPLDPGIPEDKATILFRTAYMLESNGYLADALSYYQQAEKADVRFGFCWEALLEFKRKYRVG